MVGKDTASKPQQAASACISSMIFVVVPPHRRCRRPEIDPTHRVAATRDDCQDRPNPEQWPRHLTARVGCRFRFPDKSPKRPSLISILWPGKSNSRYTTRFVPKGLSGVKPQTKATENTDPRD